MIPRPISIHNSARMAIDDASLLLQACHDGSGSTPLNVAPLTRLLPQPNPGPRTSTVRAGACINDGGIAVRNQRATVISETSAGAWASLRRAAVPVTLPHWRRIVALVEFSCGMRYASWWRAWWRAYSLPPTPLRLSRRPQRLPFRALMLGPTAMLS